MKQTAVEWLENEIFRSYKFLLQKVDCTRLEESIKQAKEMEKEQIIDAYENGYSDSDNTFELNKQYYNEQFKNK
jgi:hypothetical protein